MTLAGHALFPRTRCLSVGIPAAPACDVPWMFFFRFSSRTDMKQAYPHETKRTYMTRARAEFKATEESQESVAEYS